MERRKLESAALFVTILGAMLFAPPLTLIFQIERRVLGAPVELIYLFVAWAGLIGVAFWLGRRLPRDPPGDGEDGD